MPKYSSLNLTEALGVVDPLLILIDPEAAAEYISKTLFPDDVYVKVQDTVDESSVVFDPPETASQVVAPSLIANAVNCPDDPLELGNVNVALYTPGGKLLIACLGRSESVVCQEPIEL